MSQELADSERADSPGFSLIENVLAMILFMIVTAAALPMLIKTFQAQAGLTDKESAITVANRQLEYVRSITPGKLVAGRYSGDVAALTAAPGLVDLSNDLTTAGNSDPAATSGSGSAAVPLTMTQTLGTVVYTVRTYINPCYLSSDGSTCTAVASNGALAYRVSVDVAWRVKAGTICSSGRPGQCEYIVATLVDPTTDPTFYQYGTPAITNVNDAASGTSVAVSGIHPGQVLTLQVAGNNFAPGATAVATTGDRTAPVSSNSGTVIVVQYGASSTLGSRTFSIVNPNGTTGSTTISVTQSAPAVTALSPGTAPRNVATTFTLTGSDFFATPSLSTQTTKPSVSLSGSGSVSGVPFSFTATGSSVVVGSRTSLTFKATLPLAATAYTATGTLTLTNPDGGSATYSFTVSVT